MHHVSYIHYLAIRNTEGSVSSAHNAPHIVVTTWLHDLRSKTSDWLPVCLG